MTNSTITEKKNNFINTKILCTLGPSSDTKEKIIELIHAGIDGIRLNFSHGNHTYYTGVFNDIFEACTETSEPISIVQDLQGPKIRIGNLETDEVYLNEGEKIEIVTEDIKGTKDKISCSYEGIINDAEPGNNILLDDGAIKLYVIKKNRAGANSSLLCEVINGGVLKPRKGINLPGMHLNLPSLTAKDFADIDFGLTQRVDFIALSFVRSPKDIIELRNYIRQKGYEKNIIAKIEKREAIDNFEEILRHADGIMIARGDLGVELPAEEVPAIQKEIIAECNSQGKMVITATQMLDSMINNPVPTRAETSDVANAVWDGTDVVMLSGETSIGKYPVETIKVMNRILRETETKMEYLNRNRFPVPETHKENLFESVGKALTSMAKSIGAKAIVTLTKRGRMASALSQFKPAMPIAALTDNFEVMNILRLQWGVIPVYFSNIYDEQQAINEGVKIIKAKGIVEQGDTVIFTSGAPDDERGSDIWIKFTKA